MSGASMRLDTVQAILDGWLIGAREMIAAGRATTAEAAAAALGAAIDLQQDLGGAEGAIEALEQAALEMRRRIAARPRGGG